MDVTIEGRQCKLERADSRRRWFDDLSPTDFKMIALIPWFDRGVMRADSEAEFRSLELYERNDKFFWGVSTDSVASRL